MRPSHSYLALLLLAVIWGVTFVPAKQILQEIGPIYSVFLRFFIASLLLSGVFSKTLFHLTKKEIRYGIFMGIWLALGFILQTIGLHKTTAGKAAFITGFYVLIVPIFSAILLKRLPEKYTFIGAIISIFGLGLLSLDDRLSVQAGDLWVLCSAVAFALHIISTSHFGPKGDTLRLNIVQIIIVSLITLPLSFLFENPTLTLSSSGWGLVLLMALLPTAFAYSLYTYVQRFARPTTAAIIFCLEPVFAVIAGWLVLGEFLNGRQLTGALLMLGGVAISEVIGGRSPQVTDIAKEGHRYER